jgi:iron complex outermembrane receptor protein
MKNRTIVLLLATMGLLIGIGAGPAHAQNAATLTGTVVDEDDGSPLSGANVALREEGSLDLVDGTATGPDGTFSIEGIAPGDYIVDVRFIGHRSRELPVRLAAGATRELDIRLAVETSSLETVIISASRRQEKVLNAPASISVLGPEELEGQVATSTVEVLRATPGVDMAQTGIDRREVVLRGFNEAFSGATYVLTDYREAAVPSLGVNLHSIMPNMTVDVERVEVVRGPGSALYGPGVDSGVIHYFTKSPFDDPGTTVSVAGGQQSFLGVQGRHAGTLTERLGYKITGQFARADEWALNPNNAQDARELAQYRVYETQGAIPGGRNATEGDFDDDGEQEFQLRREDEYRKLNVNGLLQYRAGDATTISLNGGYSEVKGVVQSGIGTLQADGFGYAYGQLRLQSGGLFAQAYLNVNDSGDDTYVYGTGNTVIDKGLQWNGQLQYDFGLPALSTQVIAGADADITVPRTEGEILGRNEDEDRIEEYGTYVQTSSSLSSALELTLAGRLDYNNVVDALQVSPRAALVYKLNPVNTVRASYNRSFSSPGTNSLFLDIGAREQLLPGGNALIFRGLGAADGFTFNDFRQSGAASSLLPANFKGPMDVDQVPLQPLFGTVVGGLAQAVQSGTLDQLPSELQGLSQTQLSFLLDQLQQVAGALGQLGATTPGQLGIPNNSELGFAPGGPVDIPALKQTTTQTFEVGYKGVISDRVIINVDGYYERKEDFIGPLVVESPLLYVDPETVTTDLQGALTPILQQAAASDPQVAGLLQQFGGATQAAGFLAGVTGQQIEQGPVGVVQPDQPVLLGANPNAVGGFLSYRNFGQVEYWGLDASMQVRATDQLSAFTNVSIVSDDFFDNEELDTENAALSLALNAPSFKMKGGFNYRLQNGLSFGATGNYVEGFRVETGPYVGNVDSYFLLDLSAGYDFPTVPGLRLEVTAKNVLDNEHREFVGAPAIGLLVLGRMTYTL